MLRVLALLTSACAGAADVTGDVDEVRSRDSGAPGHGDPNMGAGEDGAGSPEAGTMPPVPGEKCARIDVVARRVVPTVWLLVDGSGSMRTPMDGTQNGASRWAVLRDALITDGTSLVALLQDQVAFGLYAYDGGLSLPGVKTPACPRVVQVGPALDNLDRIRAAYPAEPLGASTPTHYALLALRDMVRVSRHTKPGPVYVILATDGRPNLCDFHDGIPETPATSQEAVNTVAELANLDIKTFAISMAGSDAALRAHLEAVAAAGGTGQGVFTPNTSDELVDALSEIIRATVTCDVQLEGEVVAGRQCEGEVKVNGISLECDGPNGFRLKDDQKTLELLGDACETVREDPKALIEATFPCDDVVIF